MNTEATPTLKEFFYFLVQSIAQNPDLVEVVQQEKDGGVVVTVFVADDDFQRFSEQGCRTIRALDTVLMAMAKRERIDATMEVVARSASSRVN